MSTYYQTSPNARPAGSSRANDIIVPSCTIEDVDRALFKLFNEDIPLYYKENNKNSKRIPVVFATGERFAVLRRKKPLRDKAGALILPLVSILRSGVNQSATHGAGTNQTADIVIKKKLSSKDPSYQRLVNKEGLENADDRAFSGHYVPNIDSAAKDGSGTVPGEIARRRPERVVDPIFKEGKLISQKISNNIFEIFTMRAPKYFTATYDITIWAQYMQQMNRILDAIMSSYHSQGGRTFRIETDKGYYFTAFFGDSLGSELNFDDFSDDERIIKYTLSVEVTGYIINPSFPGEESTIRKYISAPQITFDMTQVSAMPESIVVAGIPSGKPDDYIMQDLNTMDDPRKAGVIGGDAVTPNPAYYKTTTVGGTTAGREPLTVERVYQDEVTGEMVKQKLNIKSRNQRKGETVYREQITFDLGEIVLTPK
ncbi:MAG TPA: hypothetical protein EYF95_07325 [Flavobacteriales bacterium]|jgi:hypothetical protein|nr:hypothetical protein [Flavobacteriales bacterium]